MNREEMEEILKKLNEILNIIESNENIHPSKPGKFTEVIKDTSEKAFQRAILFNKSTTLNDRPDDEITWYDIELPVVLNKNSRRPCIDLIGKNRNRFVLCELKFNNTSDSPCDAVRELLGYFRLVEKNAGYLDHYSIHHTNDTCIRNWKWSSIMEDNPLLVIAGNEKYWKYWMKTNKVDFNEQLQQINSWSKHLSLDILLYKTDDFDFNNEYADVNDDPKPKTSANSFLVKGKKMKVDRSHMMKTISEIEQSPVIKTDDASDILDLIE